MVIGYFVRATKHVFVVSLQWLSVKVRLLQKNGNPFVICGQPVLCIEIYGNANITFSLW